MTIKTLNTNNDTLSSVIALIFECLIYYNKGNNEKRESIDE
jgi:hypothetical protein